MHIGDALAHQETMKALDRRQRTLNGGVRVAHLAARGDKILHVAARHPIGRRDAASDQVLQIGIQVTPIGGHGVAGQVALDSQMAQKVPRVALKRG